MAVRVTKTFPKAALVARLFGFRSVTAMCRQFAFSRAKLYRALGGDESARQAVEDKLGTNITAALFSEGQCA